MQTVRSLNDPVRCKTVKYHTKELNSILQSIFHESVTPQKKWKRIAAIKAVILFM